MYERIGEEKTMNRKLASVQRVKDIHPIEGADRIEMLQILNWECVAKKGEFSVGDLVIYFEIDSLLPDIPLFEWLRGSSWSQKLNKYRIRTQTLRGQISQGLIVSIDLLSDMEMQINGNISNVVIEEGLDLTELLHIEKYEPPETNGSLGRLINHEWYVPKSDEIRIQVCAEDVLPHYMNLSPDDWYASIKLDGTSCTFGLFEDGYLVGGRSQWYQDENMYTTAIKKCGDIQTKLEDYKNINGTYVVFQGELCGPGIQKNRLGLKEKEVFVFNAFASKTGKYGSYTQCPLPYMLRLCQKFGLKHVPIIEHNKFDFKQTSDITETVNNLLKYVETLKYGDYFDTASSNQLAEGAVFRTEDMTYSFKVVSNKYLLKNGD